MVKFASQPTATPLTRPAKFHFINPDAHDRVAVLLNLAFCGYQRDGASRLLPLILKAANEKIAARKSAAP